MPRLIDWGARYDLMREAVVRIAARSGAAAVTFDAVAAELKVHPSTVRRALSSPDMLRGMGVAWIAVQQRRRTIFRGKGGHEYGSIEHIAWVLQVLLPLDAEDLELERGWRELTTAGLDETSAQLRQQRDEDLDGLIRRALATLGTESSSRDQQSIQLRALVDGLVAALCRSAITPAQATECLEGALRQLPLAPELRATEPEPRISPVVGGSPR